MTVLTLVFRHFGRNEQDGPSWFRLRSINKRIWQHEGNGFFSALY